MNAAITDIARRVLAGQRLGRDEVLSLVKLGRSRPYELLYWAHRVRTDRFADSVKLCSIIPGKVGSCREDCKWCAQSAACAPGVTKPHRMPPEQVQAAAVAAARNRASSFGIVNSGRSPTRRDVQDAVEAAGRIRTDPAAADLELCASFGELTGAQAASLAAAGFTRYNHNLETSRRFYPQVVTTHTYDDRLRTLAAAREAGMSLCCGGIFGLGETWSDRVDLAMTLRDEVRPDVVPMNFLHPIPGTPLAGTAPMPPMEILILIAVFRLVLPEVDLKIAGGRQVNLPETQSWIFYAGATSCLIGNYLTTPGRSCEQDLRMIADLGLTVVREFPVRT